MSAGATISNPNKRYEVPEGLSLNEYKELAKKYSGRYKELAKGIIEANDGISVMNFRKRMDHLRNLANKEGFENANPYIGGADDLLVKKNEQICTLVVVIIVLVTAFILLGCYLCMHGGMSGSAGRRVDTDITYRS